LKNIGALEGPLQAAHCVHLDENDLDILQQSGARVAHNPTSNLKLASGFAPVEKFLSRGIVTSLGTDGAASNNDLDMWEEMRLSALLHKATTGDATAVSAQQALLMATQNGARSLNLGDQIGSLEVGKKSDIVLMNFDKPHLMPRHNVVSHLVYAAKASDVDTVIVDGRVLVRGGQCTQMDAAQICAEANERAARLVQATQQVR
jgi:5-methylthioadenosine/S-adenosylhomocysteine deaminase